jgi:cobalt-zinc-cadmium efflux system membrane fusion protein
VDAISQYRLDQEQMEKLEALYQQGATSEAAVRQARVAVEHDLNAIARARRTLRAWRLTDKEIKQVEDEADRIAERRKKTVSDKDWDKETQWARVEVRAPFSGLIVERNVSVGDLVDTTTDMFKLADVEHLTVWAHAYEENLPELRGLPIARRHWSIRLKSDPNAKPLEGTFQEPGYVLDPNQHTALVLGEVTNPNRELRAGQSVTATILLPPPPDTVSIPATALIETGDQSVVFVQEHPDKPEYTLRRVVVAERRASVVLVFSKLPERKAGKKETNGAAKEEPLHVGARVVTQGALLMKSALENLQTAAASKH